MDSGVNAECQQVDICRIFGTESLTVASAISSSAILIFFRFNKFVLALMAGVIWHALCPQSSGRYMGAWGHAMGMNTCGASAQLKELQKKFGFDPDQDFT